MGNFKTVMPGLASVVTVLFGAGCGRDSEVDAPAVDAAITIPFMNCPQFGCGGDNSPLIKGTYFHELNMASTRANPISSSEGAALVDFTKGAASYTLHVAHGRITGTAPFLLPLSGQSLVDAQLVVAIGGMEYAVHIKQVSTVHYWAHTNGTPTIETYWLEYRPLSQNGAEWQDVCSNPPHTGPDALSMVGREHDVVVFEGERIDAATRTVALDSTGQWFNLGCAGGTLAKMALTGHTLAASDDGFVTTRAERQAIVKMFSADYCGDGKAFTVAGQPLRWADDHQTMPFLPAGWVPRSTTTLEARWTLNGAACIGAPRAAIVNTPANAAFPDPGFPDVMTEIRARCPGVPHCTDPSFQNDGYHLVSVNP
jgi:hypothetical protein